MAYQAAAAKFGTVDHNGTTLALTQQAYSDNYGTDGGVRYYAAAVDADCNEYCVEWDTTAAWNDAVESMHEAEQAVSQAGGIGKPDYDSADVSMVEDESNACAWATPAGIKAL